MRRCAVGPPTIPPRLDAGEYVVLTVSDTGSSGWTKRRSRESSSPSSPQRVREGNRSRLCECSGDRATIGGGHISSRARRARERHSRCASREPMGLRWRQRRRKHVDARCCPGPRPFFLSRTTARWGSGRTGAQRSRGYHSARRAARRRRAAACVAHARRAWIWSHGYCDAIHERPRARGSAPMRLGPLSAFFTCRATPTTRSSAADCRPRPCRSIQKPFTADNLAMQVRKVLDAA